MLKYLSLIPLVFSSLCLAQTPCTVAGRAPVANQLIVGSSTPVTGCMTPEPTSLLSTNLDTLSGTQTVAGAKTFTLAINAPMIIPTLETVAFSATPTFSAIIGRSRIVLTANVTSSTLASGTDGAHKCFTIVQGSTAFTFVWPTNVKNGMTIGTTINLRNVQCFNYSSADTLWLAEGPGSTNQ